MDGTHLYLCICVLVLCVTIVSTSVDAILLGDSSPFAPGFGRASGDLIQGAKSEGHGCYSL